MPRLDESQAILKALGLPPEQQNEAAGYTLLALAGVKVKTPWNKVSRQRLRIHDILQFTKDAYGKVYAENSRETIRRRVLHQFEQARVVDRNPDDPSRATNHPLTCYALTAEACAVIQMYGTKRFLSAVGAYQERQPSLVELYRSARQRHAVEVTLPNGVKEYLSPGRHNELQAAVIKDFYSIFIPTAKILYLGDTARKGWHVDQESLERVGLAYSAHDKFPDVVFWLAERNWLVLVEAVTSHGPVSPKRRKELETLLRRSNCHRIYVTAFPSRKEMKTHLHELAWETEVWLADEPSHMIHYNGPKFLAPLESE